MQQLFHCDNNFHRYAHFRVIYNKNDSVRNTCLTILLQKFDLVLGYQH